MTRLTGSPCRLLTAFRHLPFVVDRCDHLAPHISCWGISSCFFVLSLALCQFSTAQFEDSPKPPLFSFLFAIASTYSRLQIRRNSKMFVPKAGGRNTRRRPRTSSDDSVKPPKAKRQRSVLRRPDESHSDTNLGREIAKLAAPTPSNDDNAPADSMNTGLHLPTRTAKQNDGLGHNNEGTIALVSNVVLRVAIQGC
jgi:hypothetical protein